MGCKVECKCSCSGGKLNSCRGKGKVKAACVDGTRSVFCIRSLPGCLRCKAPQREDGLGVI